MRKTSTATLKAQLEKNLLITIDFRSDVYAPNQYGANPQMDYNRANNIVEELFVVLDLDTMYHNSNMMMNRLKTESLKSLLEDYVHLKNTGQL